MREIAASDWQTSGQWIGEKDGPPYVEEPPDEFVREVVSKCTFERVDLNGDDRPEVIVDLNYSPGMKGNRSFYVLQQRRGRWRIIGHMDGNGYRILPRGRGYASIETGGYCGGHTYVTVRYGYRRRKYTELHRKTWQPTGQ